MPRSIRYVYAFSAVNALMWTIILGTPMVLFFKELGASATMIGMVSSMVPLFNMLQLPAARYADRIGCKTLMVRGWTSRSIFVLMLAVLAWQSARLPPNLVMWLAMLLLALFSMIRGFSCCGYYPWITKLLPEERRGEFAAGDSISASLASTLIMVGSAWYVAVALPQFKYAGLFLFAYVAALSSVFFLRRIPPVQTVGLASGPGRVPWKALIFHPPFFRIIRFSMVYFFFIAAAGVFWVPMLRDLAGVSARWILGFSAVSGILSALFSMIGGRVVDRVGSRPLLGLSGSMFFINFLCWAMAAAGLLPFNIWVFGVTLVTGAMGGSFYQVSTLRLLMAAVPEAGRSHFFALSSVMNGTMNGLMPIFWGMFLDGMRAHETDGVLARWGAWHWNQYSVLYVLLMLGMVLFQVVRRKIEEPRAMHTDEFLRELYRTVPGWLWGRVVMFWRRMDI